MNHKRLPAEAGSGGPERVKLRQKKTFQSMGILCVLCALCGSIPPVCLAQGPSWWTTRGVLTTNAPSDYAPVLIGQLKHIAWQAYFEMTNSVPGGPGAAVSNLVYSFSGTNDYFVANQGQLKYVAQPFYDRLHEAGLTNALPAGMTGDYPWTESVGDDADCSPARIGQLKYAFSFDTDQDADGLADWVETGTGVYNGPTDTGTSPSEFDSDGDGLPDGQEMADGTDPNNPDSAAPTVTIHSPTNPQDIVWVP